MTAGNRNGQPETKKRKGQLEKITTEIDYSTTLNFGVLPLVEDDHVTR